GYDPEQLQYLVQHLPVLRGDGHLHPDVRQRPQGGHDRRHLDGLRAGPEHHHHRLGQSAASSSGSTVNRSPTRPTSAISKIGASASLLIATIVPASLMPVRCWIAPLMPTATYSSGAMILPVWPTCSSLGT